MAARRLEDSTREKYHFIIAELIVENVPASFALHQYIQDIIKKYTMNRKAKIEISVGGRAARSSYPFDRMLPLRNINRKVIKAMESWQLEHLSCANILQ